MTVSQAEQLIQYWENRAVENFNNRVLWKVFMARAKFYNNLAWSLD